jgi:hypothetical protein
MLKIVKQRVYVAGDGYKDLLSWQWDSNTDDPEESMERASNMVGWLQCEVKQRVIRTVEDVDTAAALVLAIDHIIEDITDSHFGTEGYGLFTEAGLLGVAMKACGASVREFDPDVGVCLSITKTTPPD